MTFVTESITTLTGWLRSAAELGMALVMTFVLIDILFPNTTCVLNNLSTVVGSFAKEGVAGLIALLLFLVLVKK
jgi:hypothetical protein